MFGIGVYALYPCHLLFIRCLFLKCRKLGFWLVRYSTALPRITLFLTLPQATRDKSFSSDFIRVFWYRTIDTWQNGKSIEMNYQDVTPTEIINRGIVFKNNNNRGIIQEPCWGSDSLRYLIELICWDKEPNMCIILCLSDMLLWIFQPQIIEEQVMNCQALIFYKTQKKNMVIT